MRRLAIGALLPFVLYLGDASAQSSQDATSAARRPAKVSSRVSPRPEPRVSAPRVSAPRVSAPRVSAPRVSAPRVSPDANGMTSLDTWIVVRLRGAQLFPDSEPVIRSVATDAVLPHIESVRDGQRFDSLFALQYSERPGVAALAASGAVRLVGPTGTIMPIAGRVIARRPFRALRAPTANHNEERDWRYGWAYLIAVPKAGRSSSEVFRGWMVVDTLSVR